MQLSCQSSEVKMKLEAKCLHPQEMSWTRKNKYKFSLIIFLMFKYMDFVISALKMESVTHQTKYLCSKNVLNFK
jgi:hypothetical protein